MAVACSSGHDVTGRDSDFTEKQNVGRSLPAMTIALTFDDGPGPRTTELSGFLRDQGIAAGFFMMGMNAKGKDAVMRQVNADGHVIGNHTWDHPLLTSLSASNPSATGLTDAETEIQNTHTVLTPFFTGNMHMFRAPYGGWSPAIADRLNETPLADYVGSIFWDIGGELTDTHAADWACWSKKLTIEDCGNRYIQEIHDRGNHGLVLMHDTHSNTIDMVKLIVPKLKAQGFRFARVDQVPDINAALLAHGATPLPVIDGSGPPPPPECGDDGMTCGGDVGRDPGSLFSCHGHRLSLACACQGACAAGSCTCAAGEPGPSPCGADVSCNPVPGAACATGCIWSRSCVGKTQHTFTATDGQPVTCVKPGSCNVECQPGG